jgi:hypothetical protein
MTRPETIADRQAYLEDDLTELACDRCSAQVRVRKSSPAQTSVQWSVRAAGQCAEFAGRSGPSALTPTCASLRDSIERAVREGRLGAGHRAGT